MSNSAAPNQRVWNVALAFGDFLFDPTRRELRKHGVILKVDPQQLDLLACFLDYPGVLLSREELHQRVWAGRAISESALSVSVAKLRKVLGRAPGSAEYIENRYGRGYRFLQAVRRVERPPVGERVVNAQPMAADLPLVGRGDHCAQLEAAFERAAQGESCLCVLLGEPGIGKTRLAEALERTARERGAGTAWARFMNGEGTPPLWPFVRLLRDLNGAGLADEALRLLSERSDEQGAALDKGESGSQLTQGLLFDAQSAAHRTSHEIAQALHGLSRERPLLLVLDDLQWADAASLRLLNFLVDEIARWRILIVATVRSSELGLEQGRPRELLNLLSRRECRRIDVQRLRESDVVEYVVAAFGEGARELGHTVYSRSGGNPFYMVELLRPWLGLAEPRAEQLRLSGLALDVLRQRLSALPEAARRVLSAAAVIGHDFDLGLLGYVAEQGADELLEALDESLANDTVVASSHVQGAYSFDHELIREVLYSELAASERCRLHQRVGEALLRRRAAGIAVPSAELAQHLLSALPQGDVGTAIAHARGAAIASMRMASHAEARALLRRALEALKFWVEPNPETLTALLLELAMVERILGDRSNIEHLRRGVALARQHRFGPLLTTAGQMLSPGPGLLARREATSVLEAAAEVLAEDDFARRAIVLAHLAWTPPNSLSARRVNTLLAQAKELAERSGQLDAMAAVQSGRLFFSAGPSTLPAAEAIADEIDRTLKLHPETVRAVRVMATVTFRLIAAMQRGDQAGMARAIAARVQVLERLNNRELSWHHERMLLVQRMNRSEWNGVSAELERLRQRAERLSLQAWSLIWVRDYGELLLRTGDIREFAAQLRPRLALTADESPATLSRKLYCMAEFGFGEDARAALQTVSTESLTDLPQDRDYLSALCQLAAASAAVGSLAHCEALYELLQPHAELYAVDASFHCAGSVSHYLGELARALGRQELALGHFQAAYERNTAFGLKGWALTSQLALANCLREEDAARAEELRARIRRDALQLGLLPLARAAEPSAR